MGHRQDWGDRVIWFPDDDVQTFRGEGLWGTRTIAQELRAVAEGHPGNLAVVAPDGRLTYADLDAKTDLVAAGLHGLGLMPSQRVLFQLSNSAAAVLAWYGALKAGLIPVCTLVQHRRREIAEIARQSEAAGHIVQAYLPRFDLVAFAQEIASCQPSMQALIAVGGSPAAPGAVPLEALGEKVDPGAARTLVDAIQASIDPDDVAVFQLSGGTTSVPKIIPRLHAEYWYNARAYADFWGWGPDARVAHLMPVVHNAGIVCALHAPHAVGACALVGVPDPDVAVPLLAGDGVTDVILNLALADLVLGRPDFRHALRTVKRLVFSGCRLPERVAAAFERDHTRIVQLFGMGEGLFMMTPNDAPVALRHHTVGIPMSGRDEVRICIPGTDRPVPDGEAGELCCRGPYTLHGYYDAPERNRQVFASDGFFHTGDIARAQVIDGIRCYSIEGRLKDVISRGGEKVNAEELRLLLLEHPDIEQVAVVAMPDSRLGERACAYVVLRSRASSLTLATVTAYLEDCELAKFKWPERLELIHDLPRTNVGKLNKQALRDDIRSKLEHEGSVAEAGGSGSARPGGGTHADRDPVTTVGDA